MARRLSLFVLVLGALVALVQRGLGPTSRACLPVPATAKERLHGDPAGRRGGRENHRDPSGRVGIHASPLDRRLDASGKRAAFDGAFAAPSAPLTGLRVLLDLIEPLPPIDLLEHLFVDLWDQEPVHLLDPERHLADDPRELDIQVRLEEASCVFQYAPRDRPLWVSVSALLWPADEHVDLVVPAIAPVPAPRGTDWTVRLPVRSPGWLVAQVVGPPEDDLELALSRSVGKLEVGDGGDLLFWPLRAGPQVLTLSTSQDGRLRVERRRFEAPGSGAHDLGRLSFAAGGSILAGRVRLEGEQEPPPWASLELDLDGGPSLRSWTDKEGQFWIEGDLLGEATLRVASEKFSWTHEPVEFALVHPLPPRLDVELPLRARPLGKILLRPVREAGARVEGMLAAVLGEGPSSAAASRASTDNPCGQGRVEVLLPLGSRMPYSAWMPEQGLSGVGFVEVPVQEGSTANRSSIDLELRASDTLVTGELLAASATGAGLDPDLRTFVRLRGDPRAEVELDDIEPGPFALAGLPAEIDFTLELRDRHNRTRLALDLHLRRGETRALGELVPTP